MIKSDYFKIHLHYKKMNFNFKINNFIFIKVNFFSLLQIICGEK